MREFNAQNMWFWLMVSIDRTGVLTLILKYLALSSKKSLLHRARTMTNKTSSKLSFFTRNLKGCPEKLKQTVYFSLIHSFMEYSATVWDPYQKYLHALKQIPHVSVKNGPPGSTRFYGPVHLRRHWSVPVSTGLYIQYLPLSH